MHTRIQGFLYQVEADTHRKELNALKMQLADAIELRCKRKSEHSFDKSYAACRVGGGTEESLGGYTSE